jgi:hypothetical protein
VSGERAGHLRGTETSRRTPTHEVESNDDADALDGHAGARCHLIDECRCRVERPARRRDECRRCVHVSCAPTTTRRRQEKSASADRPRRVAHVADMIMTMMTIMTMMIMAVVMMMMPAMIVLVDGSVLCVSVSRASLFLGFRYFFPVWLCE